MQKKHLLLSVLCSTILLAGCSSKPADSESDINLNDASNGSQTAEKSTDTKNVINTKVGGMKKLEDFEKIDAKTVTLTTSKGTIEIELFPETAPVTVASFLSLIKSKFYDGIVFHRVVPGFVIQAGDPQTKEAGKEALWGMGGPGYTIPDEFSSTFQYDAEGILAMAKTAAPNSGGSQFFITLGPAEQSLNGSYTPFGRVTKGIEVVRNIAVGDTITSATFK